MLTTNRTKKSKVFLFIHFFLFVSQKRGSSMLLQCVTQLARKSAKRVDACFSSSDRYPLSQKTDPERYLSEIKHSCTHEMSYNFTDIRPLSHEIASGCTEVKFSYWITYTFNSDDSQNRI